MLIAVRTSPYQSWVNPAERVMSILNLALQNVSLERQALAEEFEKLKDKSSIKAVRSEIEAHPELETKVNESLQPTISLLNKRFERMHLKGQQFKAAEAVTAGDMESMFSEVTAIDASLSQHNLSKKTLEKAINLQRFLEGHSSCTHYAFQLKKCLLSSCPYCSTHTSNTHASGGVQLVQLPPFTKIG